MRKKITLEEKKSIYLDMLCEVDAFCRKNSIRYSLSSGTLIGAIRHGGFIPWDDDLDITMPLPDLIRFKNEFQSDKIEYHFIDTHPDYELSFPRLVYKQTYSRTGLFKHGMGIALDIYVVVGLPEDETEYFDRGIMLFQNKLKLNRLNSFVSKYTPFNSLPSFRKTVEMYVNHLYSKSANYDKAKRFFRIAAPMYEKMVKKNILEFDLFDELNDVSFENVRCLATSHAYEYLTQRYGDFMQLPPVEQRKPRHIANYYWK